MTAVSVPVRVPLPRTSSPAPTASAATLLDGPRQLRRPAVDLEVVVPAYNEALRLPATVAATVAYLERAAVELPGRRRRQRQLGRHGPRDEVRRRPVRAGTGGRDRLRPARQGRRGPPWAADQRVAVRRLLRRRPRHARRDARHRHGAARRRRGRGRRLAVRPRLDARAPAAVGAPARRCRVPPDDPPLVPGVHDTQCGFKFFDRDAVSRALTQCRTTGFAFDVELLRRIQADGGSIVEIPVAWTDDPRSTFRPSATAWRASRRCCSSGAG